MQNSKSLPLARPLATLGLVGCFFLLALTCAVHFHTPTVDHVQPECSVCLMAAPSKMFVVPLATAPCYLAVDVVVLVATPKFLSLPLWNTAPSRSPPSLA